VVSPNAETLDSFQPLPALERTEVSQAIHAALSGRHLAPEFTLVADAGEKPKEIKISPQDFAEVARTSARQAKIADRSWADFCAAYGTDAYHDEALISETDLHFTSGQQSFLGTLRALAGDPPPPPAPASGKRQPSQRSDDQGATTAAQIEHALFETWSYSDPRPSLRWDPVDDRRYALRAYDPTNASFSPIATVRGANRLAVEALPWLPTFPCNGGARTRGFSRRNRRLDFTWPVWDSWLSADTVRSLLGLEALYEDGPPRDSLQRRGIAEVFRCRRIGGYYGNFSPAVACFGKMP
jgi:hypothetical protein